MKTSDKALSNGELELTQRIQMHFPRGSISAKTLHEWNSCSADVLTAWLKKSFSVIPTSTVQAKNSILTHVTTIDFPGMPAFNTDDFFTTKNNKVKFSSIGDNFTNWFGGMEVEATEASKLSLDRPLKSSYDPGIIKEIGEENCDQSLAVIRSHIESGQAEKDPWYAGYFLDKNGSRRAVSWCWGDYGWRVDASEVPVPDRWGVGSEFVSRKPLST